MKSTALSYLVLLAFGSTVIIFLTGCNETVVAAAAPPAVEVGKQSTITATLRNSSGGGMAGEKITFVIIDGWRCGTLGGPQAFSEVTATTDPLGNATIYFTAGPGAGEFTSASPCPVTIKVKWSKDESVSTLVVVNAYGKP